MKLSKKIIIRILEKAEDSMSIKQIRGILGLKKTSTAKLKDELYKLIKDKKIIKQGSRYFSYRDSKIKKFSKEKDSENLKKVLKTKNYLNNKKIKYKEKIEIGYFTRNKKGFGFVNTGIDHPDVFIGKNEQGDAMEGDLVKIKILISRGFRGKCKGKIVRILERATKSILARIDRQKKETIALPLIEKTGLPFIKIEKEKDHLELESGTLVEVSIWDNKKKYNNPKIPIGRIIQILDKISNLELSMKLIINENLVRTKLNENIKDYLKKYSNTVIFDSSSGRKDLRDLHFLTIDGKNARDFDDAVYVTKKKDSSKNFILFVSIADVSHYVNHNDPIDKEAHLRGTSVYFPEIAVNMLPEVLSNNLCSLRPKVNRLTLTCEMSINSEGRVVDYSIYESIIQSRASLTYEDVSNFLDGKNSSISSPTTRSIINKMYKLSKILEKKRFKRGAIQFSFLEEHFQFDKDHRVIGIDRIYQSSAMKIIEQFMLEANETIAKHCEKNKIKTIFRVHDSPDKKKLQKIQKIFHRLGIKISIDFLKKSNNFNEIINKIKNLPNFEQLQILLLRSMSLANYDTKNKGHFGLSAKYYTHFTSPIRRYPDLLVHRALKNKIYSEQKIKKKISKYFINNEIAELCSLNERRAEKAERQSIDLIKVYFLSKYIGHTFEAKITYLESHGIKIIIDSISFEWFLLLEYISNDYFTFNKTQLTLYSHQKNRVLEIGQSLEINLINANLINRTLEFRIEKWIDKNSN